MFLGTKIYALYCQLIYFVKLKSFIKIILQHQMGFGTIVHTHISLSCSFLNSLRYTKAEQQEAIRTYSQWVKNIYRFVFEFWSTDFFYPANLIRNGQLISKCPFVVRNRFDQNTNKFSLRISALVSKKRSNQKVSLIKWFLNN